MNESNANKPTALVTGASRGIGRAIALALTKRGYSVVGTSRQAAAQDAESGIRFVALDLAVEAEARDVGRRFRDVDLLVCNAGASMYGPCEELDLAKARRLFDVNFFNSIALVGEVLPGMRERGAGTIILIGSMHSESPVPFSSMYAATKSALRSYAFDLRMEVARYGVKVVYVAPFHIRTEIDPEPVFAEGSPYLERLRSVKASRDRHLIESPAPEIVAKTVLRVLDARRPKAFYASGQNAGLMAWAIRHLPRRFIENSSRKRYGDD